jgi:hypothetical protein
MPSKRKDYKVDDSAVNEKAEHFLVACELNLAAKVKMKSYVSEGVRRPRGRWFHAAAVGATDNKKNKGRSLSVPRGSDHLAPTGPGDNGNCGKAGAKNKHAKSGGCSCRHGGWG